MFLRRRAPQPVMRSSSREGAAAAAVAGVAGLPAVGRRASAMAKSAAGVNASRASNTRRTGGTMPWRSGLGELPGNVAGTPACRRPDFRRRAGGNRRSDLGDGVADPSFKSAPPARFFLESGNQEQAVIDPEAYTSTAEQATMPQATRQTTSASAGEPPASGAIRSWWLRRDQQPSANSGRGVDRQRGFSLDDQNDRP